MNHFDFLGKTSMKRKNLKLKKFFLFLAASLSAYVLYVAVIIYLYGNVNELVQADAAIVLGAEVRDNQPSPVFRERINHGIWLYKNGYVDKIIFTGGKSNGDEHSESFIARQYAVGNGIPFNDIFIEEQSTITQENLSYAAKIVKENHLSTVIIVSDPLHMKRAMLIAKDNGLVAYASPTPTTRYKSLKTQLPFLAREVFFYIGYKIVY